MDIIALKAEPRQKTGRRVAALRRSGKLPAVVYGHGITAANLEVDPREFSKAYRAAGESSLVDLMVGTAPARKVLIQEVQFDPVKDTLTHVDFREVKLTEKVRTRVKLAFTGESAAVKALGGILVKNLLELEIEALPNDLVHEIEVSITPLAAFGNSIRVKDLIIPPGIHVLSDANVVAVAVTAPRSEEELKALEGAIAEDISTVGVVEKKEKKTDEEEGAEGAAPAEKTDKAVKADKTEKKEKK